jgi:hypothetical protein
MRKRQAAIPAIKPVLATRKRNDPVARMLQRRNYLITKTDSAVALFLNGWNVGL